MWLNEKALDIRARAEAVGGQKLTRVLMPTRRGGLVR